MDIAKQDLKLLEYNKYIASSLEDYIDTYNTIMSNKSKYRENIIRLYVNKISSIKEYLQKHIDALVEILNHLEEIQSDKSITNTNLYECKKDYKDTMTKIKDTQDILAKIY